MLDTKLIHSDPEVITKKLQSKGVFFDTTAFLELDEKRKKLQQKNESLQQQRNQIAKLVGQAKSRNENIEDLRKKADQLNTEIATTSNALQELVEHIDSLITYLPNLPDDTVPLGKDEKENVEILRWSTPKKIDFEYKDHVDLIGAKGWELSKQASQISGARFSILSGPLARLHRVLAQFMLEFQIENNNYLEINPPTIVNEKALYHTGQLPKFSEDLFRLESIDEHRNFYMIPTAEVPLANLVAHQIVNTEELPLKFVAHTLCFRSEAGSSGRDTRGLIRQHQFEKVELIQIVHPENSMQTLEEMCLHAQQVLQALELPYRVIELCSGDLGFGAAKTYDIEVWIPTQNTYREISSISNCTDFQTRRMKARHKDIDTGKTELLHSLNGSGVAVGRALVAILENYQDSDGNIHIPKVLQKGMKTDVI